MCKGETHEPFRTYPFREKADDLRCTQTLLYITRTSTFSAEQEFRPSYPLERGFLYNIRRRGKRPRLRRQDFSLPFPFAVNFSQSDYLGFETTHSMMRCETVSSSSHSQLPFVASPNDVSLPSKSSCLIRAFN